MATVWGSPLTPPSLKLTALALADWSDDDGGSLYPSMSAIAKKVGVSRCQAQRLVQSLKADGLLSVVANAHGGAPGDVPHYRLHLDRFSTLTGSASATGSVSARGSADASRGVAPMHKTGSTHATLTTIEPSIEPSLLCAGSANRFDTFWAAYPRKVNKPAAKKAFLKLNPNTALLEQMIAAIEMQHQSEQWLNEEGRFIPHPSTWLKGERWTDIIHKAAEVNGLPHKSDNGWAIAAGFANRFEAENAGCTERNCFQFSNGKKLVMA